ncbi:hypothetical protein GCM10007939_00730 [Amylibacter marinus]|uniref:Tetratricopeptide repeat-containing protein n=1 Tax=Amylibacter marinus TaxID=1475483 RepID=A0ABQ5VR64_9RHOB|nr:tetratricopeptide repeat protein [Amylibacter marinus]GLQ33790.1 hypothetical protein GCM10007939_00730 [Amylibacter marinus]
MNSSPHNNSRRLRGVGLGLLCLALVACEATPTRLSPTREGIKAPAGTIKVKEAVDGLVVGHRLMAAGEYELALKAYGRASAEHGFNADILSAIGSANLKLGRIGQAETFLRNAVKLDDQFAAAWNNLGVILSIQGKLREAERTFSLAFALDQGRSEEIRTNLTKVLAKIEDEEYIQAQEQQEYELVRRGNGRFLLLQTPNSDTEQ